MDVVAELARSVLRALLQLAAQPFYYIGILFVIMQYHKQIVLERKLFSTRLHSMLDTAWKTILWGIAAGMAASLAMAFIGATVPMGVLIWLWVLSALLAVFRVRFICLAYSVGVLGILHVLTGWFPGLAELPYIGTAIQPLRELPVSSLLALVGLLHLLESFFVRKQGADMAMPMFVAGKRGKVIGGYQLQQFWPVPLLLLVPVQSGGSAAALPWTPLFGGDIWFAGWTFAALPVMLGFAERTLTRLPQQKAKRSASLLFLYSLTVLALAAGAEWLPGFALIGSVLAIALHEALLWWSGRDETASPPYYVHNEQGLRILAVLPDSPASEMGLGAGEIIHKANGVRVWTKEQLHEALSANGAFCKLEVINTEGHSKFVQRALYSGDHHLLGVLLAPDEKVLYYLERRNVSWFTKAGRRGKVITSGTNKSGAL